MAEFYCDEDLNGFIIRELIHLGHRVMKARDQSSSGTPDHIHLINAAGTGQILVTHNYRDFLLLHRAWRDWPAAWGVASAPNHHGILAVPQRGQLQPILVGNLIDHIVSQEPELTNRFYRLSVSRGWLEEQ